MAKYKTCTENTDIVKIVCADLKAHAFRELTLEVSNLPKDDTRAAAEIKRRVPKSLAWDGTFERTVQKSGKRRLHKAVYNALADFSEDGKNWKTPAELRKVCDLLGIPYETIVAAADEPMEEDN